MPNPGLLTISGSDYGIVINNYILYHNFLGNAIAFSNFFEFFSGKRENTYQKPRIFVKSAESFSWRATASDFCAPVVV